MADVVLLIDVSGSMAPCMRDAGALKAQLATLKAEGGGDEPESLLRG